MLKIETRPAQDGDLSVFRDQVRKVFEKAIYPNLDRWEEQGIVDREAWLTLGEAGLLCPTAPEAYGGLGLDFNYNAVVGEELAYAGCTAGFTMHSDIVLDYLVHYGSEEQKQQWIPEMIAGKVITGLAMTEPGAGSDVQGIRTTAKRDGNHYVVNGSKTYITNGQSADLIVVAVKTDPDAGSRGVSLVLVEGNREGFSRGRNLDKIGMHSADTSELFFNDVRIPITNCLGEEGKGFAQMMNQLPQERLTIAISAQANAQRAFDEAVKFTKERTAFKQKVFDFQNTRFTLAGLATQLQVGWAHLDWALERHRQGLLTTAEASAAKLFHTDLQWDACDISLQLHGGAGYMNEYPIARLWRDARVQRIYGGTNEIMREVIGRAI